jgi:hypothetical protein
LTNQSLNVTRINFFQSNARVTHTLIRQKSQYFFFVRLECLPNINRHQKRFFIVTPPCRIRTRHSVCLLSCCLLILMSSDFTSFTLFLTFQTLFFLHAMFLPQLHLTLRNFTKFFINKNALFYFCAFTNRMSVCVCLPKRKKNLIKLR